MEQGWDSEVKKYFKKILYAICFTLFWMMTFAGAGLYAGLAIPSRAPTLGVVIFYTVMTATLFLLIRFYFRSWKK